MKVSEVYSGSYLKTADLKGRASQVQISKVTLEEFDDGKKLCLHLSGKDRGMVLNKTNSRIIAASYGDDTDDWIGRTIEIYPDKVSFGGNIVDALRVRIPVPSAATAEELEEDVSW